MRVDGQRIRRLRKASNRTLQDLAEDASLSVSFLSQVERGLSEPSFDSLLRIAGSLNVPMTAIVRDEPAGTDGVGSHIAHESGVYRDRFVTPDTARTIQVLEAILEPGTRSRVRAYVHPEDEECVYVLQGEIEFIVDGESRRLAAGDALMIDPRLPHSYANVGAEPVRWLWISAKVSARE